MSFLTQPKRRRGGQPGNQNAKNNRGNRYARGSKGNRGGKGAPPLNQYAARKLTLAAALLRDFRGNSAAVDWIRQNNAALREIELPRKCDLASSRYSYSTEQLAAMGQEYRNGIFCVTEEE